MRKSHGFHRLKAGELSYLTFVYCAAYSMRHTVYATQYLNVMDPNLFDSLRLELRRGCLTLAVLSQLRSEHYGYTLRKGLADLGLDIDEGTLYPLLRRLETQELLTSEWREEGGRKKRFYRLSPDGRQMLKQLLAEWNGINQSLDRIV